MRRPGPSTRVDVVEWRAGDVTRHEDRLTTEEPLEIRIESPGLVARRFGVTMRTPGHDFELAAGLVLAEGLIDSLDDVRSVAYCTDVTLDDEQEFNVVTVHLDRAPRTAWVERQMTATSACGVCGTDSIAAIADGPAAPRHEHRPYDIAVLVDLPDRLRGQQRVFDRTGGLHAAGLFSVDGAPIVVREDVGRHNAVDKVVGHCLLDRLPSHGSVLCTSGRLGFEIVQKAAVAGVGAIVAVGAPTSLAVRLATSVDITVLGFTSTDRTVVYHGSENLFHDRPILAGGGTESQVPALPTDKELR